MTFKDFYEVESKKPYFKDLKAFITQARMTKTIFPEKKDLFKAFDLTPFEAVKVIILGQDPYHNLNQANGLAFSVQKGIALPPSLINIYKEIESSFNITMPRHGDLTDWATQGVLLLNTILTVEAHKPLSHQNKGWEVFTLEVIKHLNLLDQPICFMLFGSNAKKYRHYLTNPKHLILETVHPSPLSAYKGFIGSNVFRKCNDYLESLDVSPIDWQLK